MEQIHFNRAEHLRITTVEQFVPGRQYLFVHTRPDGDLFWGPPYCEEVWATGTEFTTGNELQRRGGHAL